MESHIEPYDFKTAMLFSIVLMLGSVSFGYTVSFGDSFTHSLREQGVIVSDYIESLFKSIQCLTALIGVLIFPFILNFAGRKRTTILIALFSTFAWFSFLFVSGDSLTYAIVCRAFTGIALGSFSAIIPMYIVELAPKSKVGFFGPLNQLGIAIGIVVDQLANIKADWDVQSVVGGAIPLLLLILMVFVPESPANDSFEESHGSIRQLCKGQNAKNLLIGIVLMIFQQFCGINGVLVNLNDIFKDSETMKVYAGPLSTSAQILAVFCAGPVINKIGKRWTWNLSLAGLFVSLVLIVISHIVNWPSDLIVAFVFIYFIFFGLGSGPIPWFIVPVLFEDDLRSTAMTIVTVSNWVLAFIVSYIHEILTDHTSIQVTLSVYAVSCFGAVIFGIFGMTPDAPDDFDKSNQAHATMIASREED